MKVGISELCNDAEKIRTFPAFDKLPGDYATGGLVGSKSIREALGISCLSDAMGRQSTVGKALSEAIGGNGLSRFAARTEQFPGVDATLVGGVADYQGALGLIGKSPRGSAVDKPLEVAQKSLEDSLGRSMGEYYKSRDHMQSMFGSKFGSDAITKLVNGSMGIKSDCNIAEFEQLLPDRCMQIDYPTLPPILPNPIHETNEHLAGLNKKIDALVDLQAKQAGVIHELLMLQVANEAAQERTDKRVYRLTVVGIVLTTIIGSASIIAAIL
ncbi:MAG: hypothetical protein AABZ45_08235 [Pseudomonadota bacterium]